MLFATAKWSLTMLADDDAVEQTVFSDGGLASVLKPGAIYIGSSTMSTKLAAVSRLNTPNAASRM